MNFDFDSALENAEQAELIRSLAEVDRAYLFKHALVQDTAYSSLLKQQRKHLHRAVGETLEQLFPEQRAELAATLARHYGEAGDEYKTLEYAQRAGDAAMRVFAHIEARAHFERALLAVERLPASRDHQLCRVDLILKLTEVSNLTAPHQNLMRLEQAKQILRQEEPLDVTRLAWVYQWRGYEYAVLNDARAALENFQEVESLAAQITDERLRAAPASLMGRLLIGQGNFERAQDSLERALPILQQQENLTEWLLDVGFLGTAKIGRGEIAAGSALCQQVCDLASQSNNLQAMGAGQVFMSFAAFLTNDIPALAAHAERAVEYGRAGGAGLPHYHGAGFASLGASRLGEHAKAAEWMSVCQGIAAQMGGRAYLEDWMCAIRVEVAYNAGELERAHQLAQESIAYAVSIGGLLAEGWTRRVLGKLASRRGNANATDAEFLSSIQLFEQGDVRMEAAHARIEWGKILRERGDDEAAREHFESAAAQFEISGLTRELQETRALLRNQM